MTGAFSTQGRSAYFDQASIAALCTYPELVKRLTDFLQAGTRHVERTSLDLGPGRKMLLMPSRAIDDYFGVKLVSVFDENRHRGAPTIQGLYCLFSEQTGEVVACFDAGELTARRTAAASALASKYLSRADSEVLCIAGAGGLAPYFIEAHAMVRPIRRVVVWHPTKSTFRTLAEWSEAHSVSMSVCNDLERSLSEADILSCLTPARSPFLRERMLRDGLHVDLVGAHTLSMMEAEAACFGRARVYVDSLQAALLEAGDLNDALRRGFIDRKAIVGELADLVTGRREGRGSPAEVTLFKSVGFSLEDLAAATLVFERARERAASSTESNGTSGQ